MYLNMATELLLWRKHLSTIEGTSTNIANSNRDLTHIPTRFISDLEKFYVPPENVERINTSGIFGPSTSPTRAAPGGRLFTRVTTAPAGAANIFPQSRTFGVRTNTISEASSFGLPRENIQLFLASNRISRLPLELFALRRLTVLTMRTLLVSFLFGNANLPTGSNLLTYIPPEIAQLTNLHTLNIANNRIRYLPAEMLNMTLNKLQVHPNPFLQPPPGSSPPRRTPRRTSTTENDQSRAEVLGCPVSSATHPLPRVIPLVELSLRALLASPGREECMLSLQYELPLYEHPSCPGEPSLPAGKQRFYRVIPPHLREILDACVPGSVYADSEEEAESLPVSVEVTGIGSCLSPRHGSRRAVFAQHAEERFTWDNTIAGVDIGGAVPMKWRGCEWGCLDFLTSKKEDASVEPAHDEDDLDMENVVQVVDFTSDVFGGDVFE